MSFLNTSAHQKFIAQCDSLISDFPKNAESLVNDGTEELKSDIVQLKKLAETYLQTFARLPGLSQEYNILQKRIRVKMRKLQVGKRTDLKKFRKASKKNNV